MQADKKDVTQSLCISPEDMKYMIRDTATGAYYDIRSQDTETMFTQEDKKLTKLTSSPTKKPWQDWWKKKRKQGFLLHAAAERGELGQVLELLDPVKQDDLVADVNAKGLDEFTPLHFAASEGHMEVVQALLEKGANVDALSKALRTPLHMACTRGYTKIIEVLINHSANINAQDNDGNTPVHILSECGWLDALSLCLKQKPDLTVKNKYLQTPIEMAANLQVHNLFRTACCTPDKKEKTEESGTYTRTVVQNVILHNNRVDMVKSLLLKVGAIGRATENPSVAQTSQSSTTTASTKDPSKQKSRRVRIIEAAKELSELEIEEVKGKPKFDPEDDLEDKIGPGYFDIIQLLGKGSFGEVYLVKYKLTGKPYAMKVLSKKRIMGQNLVKYATAERNVLCYTKHPFIVGLDFAFQTSDKLFLILEYCPGYYWLEEYNTHFITIEAT